MTKEEEKKVVLCILKEIPNSGLQVMFWVQKYERYNFWTCYLGLVLTMHVIQNHRYCGVPAE